MNTVPKTTQQVKRSSTMNIIINNAESTKEVLNEVQKHVRTNPIAYENIVCAIRVVENRLRDVSNKDRLVAVSCATFTAIPAIRIICLLGSLQNMTARAGTSPTSTATSALLMDALPICTSPKRPNSVLCVV